jgi:hypothetical protein
MENLHTEIYDEQFKKNVPHFNNYPELLPFIGENWNESPLKFLIIAESHYIDKDALKETHYSNWYEETSNNFNKLEINLNYYRNYINTRYNVNNAFIEFKKPYTHYYNIRSAIRDSITFFEKKEYVLDYLAYYNYFQRPAFVQGETIDNNDVDNEKAYKTLNSLLEIINPNKVIFISKKSFDAYNQSRIMNNDPVLDIIKNNFTPHAGSAWWNKKSVNYGKHIGSNENRTGRERFIDIITNKI